MKLTPDAKGADAARRYIAELMRKATGGSIVFDAYVRDDLAGDFAWNLANHLLATPAPLSDEPVAEDAEWMVTLDSRDLFDKFRACWRDGQSYGTSSEQASWSMATDYAVKAIEFLKIAAPPTNPSDKQEAVVYAVSDEAAMQWVERHDLENIIRDPGTARCAIDDARSLHLIDAPLAQSAEQDRIDAERWRNARRRGWLTDRDAEEIDANIAKGASK